MNQLFPAARDAFQLFRDLTHIMVGRKTVWLKDVESSEVVVRAFALELLEALLSDFPQVFEVHQEFKYMLRKKICRPLTTEITSVQTTIDGQIPFALYVRYCRVLITIIENFPGKYRQKLTQTIINVLKIAKQNNETWKQALSIEVVHRLISQPELLRNICQQEMQVNEKLEQANQKGKLESFPDLIKTISSVIKLSSSRGDENGLEMNGNTFTHKSETGTVHVGSVYLEMFDKHTSPNVNLGYVISTAVLALLDFLSGVSQIAERELSNNTTEIISIPEPEPPKEEDKKEKKKDKKEKKKKDKKKSKNEPELVEEEKPEPTQPVTKPNLKISVVRKMLSYSWQHVLKSVGDLLAWWSDEAILEWVLQCLEKYSGITLEKT